MALQLDEIHSPSNGSTTLNDFNDKSCSELNSAFGNLRGKPCKSNFKTRNDVQFTVKKRQTTCIVDDNIKVELLNMTHGRITLDIESLYENPCCGFGHGEG